MTRVKATHYKHGANFDDKNIGGDVLVDHTELVGGQTERVYYPRFLDGEVTSRFSLEVQADYEVFNDAFVEVELRRHVVSEPGRTHSFHELSFRIEARY